MKLNLTANNVPEQRIKDYLEQNASPLLAVKINKGTPIEKDGKQLINRKTLAGFFKYAGEQARKVAQKGANFACVDDNTVFGWAIHYFEEEAIEGEIFNLDGTPYKPTPKSAPEKKAPTTAKTTAEKPKAPTPKQTPTATEKTAQSEKKAVILPFPTPKPEQTKKLKKDKPTDTDQISIFDLF